MNEMNLLKKYGSPLYVYDYDVLKERCMDMVSFGKGLGDRLGLKVSMHYSTKANGNLRLLELIKEFGLKIDSMSLLEYNLAKEAGFSNQDILYVCNNISTDEMREIGKEDILMCFDSISQVESFGKIYNNRDIMIRINPNSKGVGHSSKVITTGKETKFGITPYNVSSLKEVCKKYNLNIKGIHLHLGSLFLDDKIDDYISGVRDFLEIVSEYFENIKIVDLGGGFGVDYQRNKRLSLALLEDRLYEVISSFKGDLKYLEEIKFEPGRYVVCEAGYILGTVNSLKKENDIYWIGTDIGMNVLLRPSMYDAYHEIEIVSLNKNRIIANICGNICESCDVLGRKRDVICPSLGDVVKVYDAGAYGYSMVSSYTGRLRPAEVLKHGKDVKLIRKKEEISDVMRYF